MLRVPLLALLFLPMAACGSSDVEDDDPADRSAAMSPSAAPATRDLPTDVSSAASGERRAEAQARLDSAAALARVVETQAPGCTAAVGRAGQVVWAGAAGLADTATSTPLTVEHAVDVASVSKQFTATVVLLLADDRALSLDDPVERWLPGRFAWGDDVTLDQLVHHTAGLPDYTTLLAAGGLALTDRTTQDDALSAIARADRRRSGTFAYSNSHYVVLAEVVEAVTGQPFGEVLTERIAEPLGLDLELRPGAPADRMALGHERTPDGGWRPVRAHWQQVGDGSVRVTPSDLVRWADNYRTGTVGGRPLLDAQIAGAESMGADAAYGAGIVVGHDGALSHQGAWAGVVTLFGITADRRTSIAVTCLSPEADVLALAESLRSTWT